MHIAGTKNAAMAVFLALFFLMLGWGILLQFQPAHTNASNYFFNIGYALLYGIGGFVGIFGAYYITTNISMGKAFLYLGIAQFSYMAGLCIWAYYNIIAKIPVPYPSGADIFFVLYYPLLAVGCWYLLSMVQTHIHLRHLFEVLAIFFVSAVVIVGFLNVPDTTGSLPVVTRIVNLWYPLGDSLLIAIVYLAFRAGRAKFQSGMLVLILGLLIQVFADIIFSYRTGANIYWNGDISDILFAVSGWTISFGILNFFYDFTGPGSSEDG